MMRARALAALVVIGLAVPLVADTSAAIGDTTSAPPVSVTLTALTPLAPQPGDTLTLAGVLRDTSPTAVTNLGLDLIVRHTKIGSRSEFDTYATDGSLVGDVVPSANLTIGTRALAPGTSTNFVFTVKVDDLDLPEPWEVYEMGVAVHGATPAGTTLVGELRTFLPWAPLGVPGVGQPTQVAWVMPLVDQPHRSVGVTWTDNALASALSAGGRLDRLVSAGEAAEAQHPAPVTKPKKSTGKKTTKKQQPHPVVTPVPVSWAIDPMVVADAKAMSAGYHVSGVAASKLAAGQRAARSWLSSLRTAVARGEVIGLPFADPDIVAAVRAGLGTQIQSAMTAGQVLLSEDLGTTPLAFGWPPDGLIDQHTLDTLFAGGITTDVLSDAALPIVGGEPTETPGAHATVAARDGTVDALLVDSGLSDVVNDGAQNSQLAPLALQRFLAETLMIQAEQPSDQRAVVVAPDRHWNPSTSYVTALLADTGKVPWIQPIPLSQVLQSPISTLVKRGPLDYPSAERSRELPFDYMRSVSQSSADLESFASILLLPPDDNEIRDYDDALLRTMSSAWRSNLRGGRALLAQVGTSLANTMNGVRIASARGSFVTLTSHSGTVPVTVANDLPVPVRVVVRLGRNQHLRVSGNGETVRTLPASRQIAIDLHATAETSGVFPLTVTLYTPSGEPYGPTVQLFVRSTAYGSVALLITGGATAVLLVAVAVRLTRRIRAARLARETT